jgi:hypothetical protein
MLLGSNKIIDNIPLSFLDPVFLARSQKKDITGFIVVSYEEFNDIFFFNNSVIVDVCRITPDFRFRIRLDDSLEKVYFTKANNLPANVYLFHTTLKLFNEFRYTFYLEPCLKLHTSLLDQNKIVKLPELQICSKGILELNTFDQAPFLIGLEHIEDNQSCIHDINNFIKNVNIDGRLVLYDIDKNKRIFKEKYFGRYDDIDKTINKYTKLIKKLDNNSFYFSKNIKIENKITEKDFSTSGDELVIASPSPINKQQEEFNNAEPSMDNDIIDEFESILNTISNSNNNEGNFNNVPNAIADQVSKIVSNQDDNSQTESDKTESEETAPINSESLLKEAINEFFRLYVADLKENVKKWNQILSKSIENIKSKHIEIKDNSITTDKIDIPLKSYPLLFEIAFGTLKHLNHFTQLPKKKKLKNKLINHLQDFYNKKYELLEHFNLLEKVEEIYSKNK